MTVCNVKGILSDKPTENYNPTVQFLFRSIELFSLFLLIILVFWLTNSVLINIISSSSTQLEKNWMNPLHTNRLAPNKLSGDQKHGSK